MSSWRNLAYGTMVVILPACLHSQSPDAAMLHATSGVLLNGNPSPSSSALFPNDLLQTTKDAEAKIDASGSTATVAPDSLAQFEGNQLFLEHGTVHVTTSTQMAVRVGCINVVPVVAGWTQYDVTDIDGKVTVVALKSDVNIETRRSGQMKPESARAQKVTVREGERAGREEKCGAAIRAPEYVAGKAAFLNSLQGRIIGTVIVGAITCIGLCHDDDPVSPYKP